MEGSKQLEGSEFEGKDEHDSGAAEDVDIINSTPAISSCLLEVMVSTAKRCEC